MIFKFHFFHKRIPLKIFTLKFFHATPIDALTMFFFNIIFPKNTKYLKFLKQHFVFKKPAASSLGR